MKILKFMAISTVRFVGMILCIFAVGFPTHQSVGAEPVPAGTQPDSHSHAVEACGTWKHLGRDRDGALKAESLSRPFDGPLYRNSSHFRVHYLNGSLDEYADSVLSAAERAFSVLVDTLGYFQPPSDAPNGGDGRTDIYLQPSADVSYLGVTYPETWIGAPYPNSYTSYIALTDTMGIDLLLTTTVHEFFHVVQIGYDVDENTSFLELISVWCEDRIYDDINAYRRHLPGFFSSPHKALFGHVYSNVVWALYLTENFGDDVIQDILEACGEVTGSNIRQASEDVLSTYGTDMITEVSNFNLWNFYTGVRDDGLHYQEGSDYPLVLIEETVDCIPLIGYTNTTHKAGTMGCNYYHIHGDYHTDSLRLDVVPEYWATSVIRTTKFAAGTASTDRYDYPQLTIDAPPIMEALWSETDSLLLVYTIDSSAQPINGFGLSATHSVAAPPLQPYVLILDRDGCRRPFDGIGDEFSERTGEDYPFAVAMAQDSLLFVLSDSIPEILSYCDAIMIVGGYGDMGTLFSAAELETLMAYMDRGGDVYLESNRLGEWFDPSVGLPSPSEEAFWGYFGCNFIAGDTMTVGNVTSWQTQDHSAMGAFAYSYDGGSPPDNFVGELVPSPADTLAVDQSGRVRATIHIGPGDSYRIHSTVLLGASTPMNAESSRNRYLFRILELFDSSVPSLAVTSMEIRIDNERVVFEGIIEGYNNELLSLCRLNEAGNNTDIVIPLTIVMDGGKVRLYATDSPPPGNIYSYRLTSSGGDFERVLWEGEAEVSGVPLSIRAVYPNPTTGDFTMFVESPQVETAALQIYDAAGRLVFRETQTLGVGRNEIHFDGRDRHGAGLSSGVYFLRLESSGQSFHKKIVIVR
jgi:hypothetical protein